MVTQSKLLKKSPKHELAFGVKHSNDDDVDAGAETSVDRVVCHHRRRRRHHHRNRYPYHHNHHLHRHHHRHHHQPHRHYRHDLQMYYQIQGQSVNLKPSVSLVSREQNNNTPNEMGQSGSLNSELPDLRLLPRFMNCNRVSSFGLNP